VRYTCLPALAQFRGKDLGDRLFELLHDIEVHYYFSVCGHVAHQPYLRRFAEKPETISGQSLSDFAIGTC